MIQVKYTQISNIKRFAHYCWHLFTIFKCLVMPYTVTTNCLLCWQAITFYIVRCNSVTLTRVTARTTTSNTEWQNKNDLRATSKDVTFIALLYGLHAMHQLTKQFLTSIHKIRQQKRTRTHTHMHTQNKHSKNATNFFFRAEWDFLIYWSHHFMRLTRMSKKNLATIFILVRLHFRQKNLLQITRKVKM